MSRTREERTEIANLIASARKELIRAENEYFRMEQPGSLYGNGMQQRLELVTAQSLLAIAVAIDAHTR